MPVNVVYRLMQPHGLIFSDEKDVWCQLLLTEGQEFHYVYLRSGYQHQTQIKSIVEGKYGLNAQACRRETFAEGNGRLPMQIGFKTEGAALKLLHELEAAIIANIKYAAPTVRPGSITKIF